MRVVLCLFLMVPGGLAQEQAHPGGQPTGLAPYRLSVGDVIDLKFYYNPELNAELTVRPDGMISHTLVGEVRAAGQNPAELSATLTAGYSRHLRNPEVTVVVKGFSGQKIFVGGEVTGPRALELRGELTCLQAILSAGGPRPSARLSEVLLVRYQGEGKAEIQRLDLSKVLKGKAEDPRLQAYDVLMVPKRRVSKVSQFVDEYINAMIPRSLFFPYNLNNTISYYVR